jgi:drug/metabolite transporter (DMT)-like permease
MQCAGAAAVLLIPALVSRPAHVPSLLAIGAVLALGFGGTGLAMVLSFRLIQRIGASRTSVVTYLLPPFAIFWGWLFLHERPGPVTFVSLALILSGVFLTTRRSKPVPVAA